MARAAECGVLSSPHLQPVQRMADPALVDQDDEAIRSLQERGLSEKESEESSQSASQESQELQPLQESSGATGRGSWSFQMARELHTMGALDMIKESVAVLRGITPLFAWLTLLFAAPFSAILLSQHWILGPLPHKLAARLHLAAAVPSVRAAALKLSENLVSHAFQLPFYVALALPARAAVSTAVAAGAPADFHLPSFLRHAAPRIWYRAVITCLWICALMLVCVTAVLSLLLLLTALFRSADLSPDLLLLLLVAAALGFSLLFAHLVIISSLAITISILENLRGRAALIKAILILRGRTQAGLLLFIVSTAVTASVDGLYQYRVVGVPGYDYKIDLASKVWEMPLLIAMHAFFYLFDAIPCTIFYFSCKSAACEIFDGSFPLQSELAPKV